MKIKKIFTIFLVFFVNNITNIVYGNEIKDGLLNNGETIMPGVENTNENILLSLFKYVKESLSSLLMVTAIGVFLYIGMRLVVARGNSEEFKKAILHFVYAAVGMFIISFAYAAVKLVSGINF